jgi:hypothetical protein
MYPPIKATASDSKAATISSSQFAAGSQSESVKPNNGDWASESPMFRAAPGPRLGCAKDAGRPTRNCAGIGRPPPLRRRWAVVADQNFEAFRCQRLPRQGSGRDIAEALVRANYGLRLGKFELDFADGEVGFQVSQILVDEAVGQDVIDRILGTTVNMLETYLPGLLSVVYAMRSTAQNAAMQLELGARYKRPARNTGKDAPRTGKFRLSPWIYCRANNGSSLPGRGSDDFPHANWIASHIKVPAYFAQQVIHATGTDPIR